jgi:hypothetical protein
MKNFISLAIIVLFSTASHADVDIHIREPISVMEAAIVAGSEELVGKNDDCFVKVTRENYGDTIQYYIRFSTAKNPHDRTARNSIIANLFSVTQIKAMSDSGINFIHFKGSDIESNVQWIFKMNKETRELTSVSYKSGFFSRKKTCNF